MAPVTRLAAALCLALAVPTAAQGPTLEYQVKAAYIYNFTKYVEWPSGALGTGPLTICIAGRNPFGVALDDIVRDERIDNRPVAVHVILEPDPACHVVFVPDGAATPAYLRAAQGRPVLTIGEMPGFIAMGGIVNFVRDRDNVRFEINPEAAERANLRISSRVMRLARPPDRGSLTP